MSPRLILYGRDFGFHWRPEGPELQPFLVVNSGRLGSHWFRSRIRCSHLNPAFEVSDHSLRKFSLRRHFITFISQGLQQHAFIRFAGDKSWPRISTGHQRVTKVQPQATFRSRVGARVTFIALFDQDRANLRLEELQLLSGWRSTRGQVFGRLKLLKNSSDRSCHQDRHNAKQNAFHD